MSKLHINHIKVKLEEIYSELIDLPSNIDENKKENLFLTRAYAAYTLRVLAQVDEKTSAEAITDDYNDNGIDAIYYDKRNKNLWILQSKWIKNGMGEPDLGDINKFKNGIIDLIDLKFERFNDKIKSKQGYIIEALNDPSVKIRIVLTHTGQDTFSEHNQRVIDDLLKDLNDPSELAIFNRFSIKQAHKSLIGIIEGQPINSDIMLLNWGKVEEPYNAIYGTISGGDLAQIWNENRGRLFSDNIRDFIGFSEVNEDIRQTAIHEPENFYFYNNGVTALCQTLKKKPIGGGDRSLGVFVAEDLKIVNGAQTVGSIGNAYETNPEQVDKIKIFLKIISLDNCPPEFGLNVTKKTNTQNRVDKKDFVSLDSEQDRLKTEFALEGITYHLKRSNEIQIMDEKNCYVEELIIAIACSKDNVDLAVQAKREVGKLWEETTKKPYNEIITNKLSAMKCWRAIQIQRKLNKILKSKETNAIGREKACFIHSNRFVLHMFFNKIDDRVINDPNYDFDQFINNTFEKTLDDIVNKTFSKIEELYPSSLVHQIFRNFTKCRKLKEVLL